jgi:(p)ppGpp synthase/HD superfamily hydrolase
MPAVQKVRKLLKRLSKSEVRVKSLCHSVTKVRHYMEKAKQEDLVERAIETAVKAHEKQKRKGTRIAYITHPFAVGITLAQAGCSEQVLAAGILHDTIEDARIKLIRIREEFGEKVASIVEKCTEPDKRRSWRKRKQHTLHSLKKAGLDVKFVVCADKLHNIRTISRDYKKVGNRVWKRFRRGREDQQWYYTSLVESLRITESNTSYQKLYKEFKRKVREVFGVSQKGGMKHEQRS